MGALAHGSLQNSSIWWIEMHQTRCFGLIRSSVIHFNALGLILPEKRRYNDSISILLKFEPQLEIMSEGSVTAAFSNSSNIALSASINLIRDVLERFFLGVSFSGIIR